MDRLLEQALHRLVIEGWLEVTTSRGKLLRFGNGRGTLIAIRFNDQRAQFDFLRDPEMKLGELYMDERITLDHGSIYDLVFLFVSIQSRFKPPLLVRGLERVRFATRRFRQRNFPRQSQRNVAHHYDIGNELYRMFLDDDMQYSCAYFEHEDASLNEAQRAKMRLVSAKLALRPGHSVLDIGCGWGGLSQFIAGNFEGTTVEGITLSQQQLTIAHSRARISASGPRLQFSITDYRNIDKVFDRIVSVGMFEHVGVAFYDTFFHQCSRLLNDDGVMVLHTIGCSDVPGFVTPWLDKYIFPGGYIPSLSEIIPPIENAGLIVADIEILQGLHYAVTLRHWRDRFMAKRDQARALYDDKFCRMWEFYLAAAEVAFRCENLVVFQIQLTKTPGVLPRTRSYIANTMNQLAATNCSSPTRLQGR